MDKGFGGNGPEPKKDYGIKNPAAYFPLEVHSSLSGIEGTIQTPRGIFPEVSFNWPEYNMYNILAAWAAGEGIFWKGGIIQKGIEALTLVPGRMETVPNRNGSDHPGGLFPYTGGLAFCLAVVEGIQLRKNRSPFSAAVGTGTPIKRPLMGRSPEN